MSNHQATPESAIEISGERGGKIGDRRAPSFDRARLADALLGVIDTLGRWLRCSPPMREAVGPRRPLGCILDPHVLAAAPMDADAATLMQVARMIGRPLYIPISSEMLTAIAAEAGRRAASILEN